MATAKGDSVFLSVCLVLRRIASCSPCGVLTPRQVAGTEVAGNRNANRSFSCHPLCATLVKETVFSLFQTRHMMRTCCFTFTQASCSSRCRVILPRNRPSSKLMSPWVFWSEGLEGFPEDHGNGSQNMDLIGYRKSLDEASHRVNTTPDRGANRGIA
jgi:hypothetical protein